MDEHFYHEPLIILTFFLSASVTCHASLPLGSFTQASCETLAQLTSYETRGFAKHLGERGKHEGGRRRDSEEQTSTSGIARSCLVGMWCAGEGSTIPREEARSA